MRVWYLLLSAVLTAFGTSPISAQPTPAGKLDNVPKPPVIKPVDYDLFHLYLLEHLYRDTFFPDGRSRRVGSDLRRFLDARQGFVAQLVAKLAKDGTDTAFRDGFRAYEVALTKLEALQTSMQALEDRYRREVAALYAAGEQRMKVTYTAAALRALGAGGVALENAPEGREVQSFFDAAFARALADAPATYASQLALYRDTQRTVQGYHAREWPNLKEQYQSLNTRAANEFKNTRQESFGKLNLAAPRLAARADERAVALRAAAYADRMNPTKAKVAAEAELSRWGAGEGKFDPYYDLSAITPADRPRDPFRPLYMLFQGVEPPSVADPESIRAAQELAKQCLVPLDRLTSMFPNGAVYNPVRVQLAETAGRLANQAAAAAVGLAGLRRGNSQEYGSPAYTALKA